jgi:hypothetical protein
MQIALQLENFNKGLNVGISSQKDRQNIETNLVSKLRDCTYPFTSRGINSTAHSKSPLKWTENSFESVFSPLQRT